MNRTAYIKCHFKHYFSFNFNNLFLIVGGNQSTWKKTSPCVKCCFTFHNHSRVFNNEQNSYRKMGLDCEIEINELYVTITILTIHKQRLIDLS